MSAPVLVDVQAHAVNQVTRPALSIHTSTARTMTKAPLSRSPLKKSHRKQFRPTLWLSNAQSTSAADVQSQSSEMPHEGFWMPQDIFKKQDDTSETVEAMTADISLDRFSEGELSEYPEPDEVENALDEDAIEAQLVGHSHPTRSGKSLTTSAPGC